MGIFGRAAPQAYSGPWYNGNQTQDQFDRGPMRRVRRSPLATVDATPLPAAPDTSGLDTPVTQFQTRKPGIFGPIARAAKNYWTPDNKALVVAALGDFTDGTTTVPQVLQSINENRRQSEEDAYTRQERARAEQQRARLEEYIAKLPAEQQAYARLNPEAFVKAMLAAQADGGGYEYHDYGAFDTRTGQWSALPGAAETYRRAHPQAAGSMGVPPLPPGFQIETGN